MKPLTKAERSDRNRKAIAGVRKQLASTKTVVLDGVSYAPDDIVKPPSGPHELIEVGGGIGCGCTCRHPAANKAAMISSRRILDIATSDRIQLSKSI